jgi:hypothetical protein
MIKGNMGYHRIFLIFQVNFPIRTDPGELLVDPDAKTAVFTLHMVLLSDMRKIQVTYVVVMIETDKKFAVSDRYVSGHEFTPLEPGEFTRSYAAKLTSVRMVNLR